MMDHSTEQTHAANFNKTHLRRAFLLALIPAVLLAAKMAESAEFTVPQQDAAAWTIQIEPGQTSVELALQDGADTLPPADPFAPAAPAEAVPAPEPVNDWGIAIVPQQKVTLNGMTYRQAYESIPFIRSVYVANPAYRHDAAMELLTGVPRQSVHATYEARLNNPIPPQPEFQYNNWTGAGGYGPYGGLYGGLGRYGVIYPPAFRYFLPLNFGY